MAVQQLVKPRSVFPLPHIPDSEFHGPNLWDVEGFEFANTIGGTSPKRERHGRRRDLKPLEVLIDGIADGPGGFAVHLRDWARHLDNYGVNVYIPDHRKCEYPEVAKLKKTKVENPIEILTYPGCAFHPKNPDRYVIGYSVFETLKFPDIFKKNAEDVDELWTSSRFCYDRFIEVGIPKEKIMIISEGVDTTKFHPYVPPLIKPSSTMRFFNICGYSERKGMRTLINAFLKEFDSKEDVELWVFGGWYSEKKAQGEIEELKRDIQNASFPKIMLDWSDRLDSKMPGLFNSFDCGVFPSKGEGYCTFSDTPIVTNFGEKEIKDITIGSRVLTHDGTFSTVTKTFEREHDGGMIQVNPAYLPKVTLTPEHRVLAIKTSKCSANGSRAKSTLCKPTCNHVSKGQWSKYYKKYEEAKELLKSKSYTQTAKELGVSPSTLYTWFVKGKIPYPDKCLAFFRRYTKDWIPANELEKGDVLLFPRVKEFLDKSYLLLSDFAKHIIVDGGYVYPAQDNHGRLLKHPTAHRIKNKIAVDDDFLRISGLYIAEGCTSGSTLAFSFNSNEKSYIDTVVEWAKGFNITAKVNYLERNRATVWVHSKLLATLFGSLYGKGSHFKRLPEWVIYLPIDKLKVLVKAMWDGDGYVGKDTLEYSTVSPVLAKQLWIILAKIGIVSSLKDAKNRVEYKIVIQGKQGEWIGNNGEHLSKRFTFGWVDDDYVYLPIKSILPKAYHGMVYNLEVDKQNSYVSSFIMHNCRPLAESAACELPVITTDYAPMTEIITKDTGYLIDVDHLGPEPRADWICDLYKGADFVHPSEISLRAQMREVFENYEEAEEKAKRGRKYIVQHHNTATAIEDAITRLREIQDGLIT